MNFIFPAETWEVLSYIVTVVGFPLAIVFYYFDNRKDQQADEEELYQRLSEEYVNFSKLLLENADLKLWSAEEYAKELTMEQQERKNIIFDLLVSLFERAYILVYEEDMSPQSRRLWASWDDYIRFWCKRRDFRASLAETLIGEDPDFGKYVRKIATEAEKLSANPSQTSFMI
jgi:hypothetical protein